MGKSILFVGLTVVFLLSGCKNTTIEEKSEEEGIAITLDLNDGSTPVKYLIPEDLKFAKTMTPTRLDHVFAGWFYDSEFTEKVTWTGSEYITVDSNKTIYAKWEEGTNVAYSGDYYDSINFAGTRQEIYDQLKALITVPLAKDPYELAKTTLRFSDVDPDNPNNVLLVYTRNSVEGPWSYGGVNWNREHVWPQSKMPGPGNELDNHNLKPCNPSINSSRGNKAYGDSTTTSTYYPGEPDKGDVSRIIMYMSVRWDLTISNLILDPELLQKWIVIDPVDAFEANRNTVIEKYQHNRNPFIDIPGLAYYFWG
jgi:uncharacterized repeat protein (TIGR02543 family)